MPYSYCSGEKERARRLRQIQRGQIKAWKGRQKLKSWTQIDRVAKRNAAVSPEAEAKPKPKRVRRVLGVSMGGGGK